MPRPEDETVCSLLEYCQRKSLWPARPKARFPGHDSTHIPASCWGAASALSNSTDKVTRSPRGRTSRSPCAMVAPRALAAAVASGIAPIGLAGTTEIQRALGRQRSDPPPVPGISRDLGRQPPPDTPRAKSSESCFSGVELTASELTAFARTSEFINMSFSRKTKERIARSLRGKNSQSPRATKSAS